MTEETKRKQMSTSTSLGTSQMKTFAGRGISVSRPSLSSHSIYLNSADIDAVLTIATNHPWRCTLCLASHCSSLAFGNIIAQDSSLAIRLHEPTSTGSLRSMSSTQATTSHTKQA